MRVQVIHGDALEVMPTLSGLDSCVCDPPYELAFMGREWDQSGVAFNVETWRFVLTALKPGAHLVAFGGTRTFHRMACAIEDAGFEIRDTLAWLYGTGFPKSHDVAQNIEKMGTIGAARRKGRELGLPRNRFSGDVEGTLIADTGGKVPLTTPEAQQWQGWGTALKPAFEPIIIARKPLSEKTVAANVRRHGTGAINIDATRVETSEEIPRFTTNGTSKFQIGGSVQNVTRAGSTNMGRWPANVLHDGSEEVEAAFAAFGDKGGGFGKRGAGGQHGVYSPIGGTMQTVGFGDSGSASRFFYSAKADANDRAWSRHPTVKPIALMRWLVRLITPPGGTVLDCFAGSGTTGEAARLGGFNAVLIEREAEYVADIHKRLGRASGDDTPLFAY